MVARKVKTAMGLQKSRGDAKAKPDVPPIPKSSLSSSAKKQQQKGPMQYSRGRLVFTSHGPPRRSSRGCRMSWSSSASPRSKGEIETRLRTELLEQKLPKESAVIVPIVEKKIEVRDSEIEMFIKKIDCLEMENERLRSKNESLLPTHGIVEAEPQVRKENLGLHNAC